MAISAEGTTRAGGERFGPHTRRDRVDPGVRAHQEWLGLIQPVGLVVAPHALQAAQVEVDRSQTQRWLAYDSLLETNGHDERVLPDWPRFATEFLEWRTDQIAGGESGLALPSELTVALPELNTQLEPSYAVPDPYHDGKWMLLIRIEEPGLTLDRALEARSSGWNASPHDRFERLLRETGVGMGLLIGEDGHGHQEVRFVYAPRGESSGWLCFPVSTMATSHGRPMLMAFYELFKGWRLTRACPETRGLRRLLEDSRKYQNDVSTRLAEQVLAALYELACGFQAADDASGGTVLHSPLRETPGDVYGGLLSTIMRVVFVLYAEERGMLPQDSAWVENYGMGSLLDRLRTDRARYPDTMDQRYGAWPRLLTLFRILHDGASHDGIRVPPRAGDLFDPDKYPFLEGRQLFSRRVTDERLTTVPRVSDGTILRILERLLILDQERLSYRALDVEQIGSVYEAMMGFEALAARGTSIAVRPQTRKTGAVSHPIVNLDVLLAQAAPDRVKWLKQEADCELPPANAQALKAASTIADLLAALEPRRSAYTPQPVKLGGLILAPTEERRRTGSHYTPRELTEPIVERTLKPILETLGSTPTPEQLLALRICDPAMGSGAFLVGACRFLGERLAQAWQREGYPPTIPPDESINLLARRLIVQRCLFGVDRNPYAVQLAKLSLWLVTLARDHPFTFLDHSLRAGDSLVGLTLRQIETFQWDVKKTKQITAWGPRVADAVRNAADSRARIEQMAETDDTAEKRRLLAEADMALEFVRLTGDAVIAAFFSDEKPRKREAARAEFEVVVANSVDSVLPGGRLQSIAEELRAREPAVTPFHWEIEFPEVFGKLRERPGFDAIVGNPPFAGKNTLIASNPKHYLDWLQEIHEGAHGNSDLVAHFFRRAYRLLRDDGAFGLIATNTIAQGDTRASGLRWLRKHGCTIFYARRRYRWPGAAAVVVSVLHGVKGDYTGAKLLDGRQVGLITAFLFHAGGDDDPAPLTENAGKSFQGTIVLGMGFTFDDQNDAATPIAEMHRLIAANPKNSEVIFPYIGGEEVNESPTHEHRRYVINFGERSESDARHSWPELMQLVEEKVKPQRLRQNDRFGQEYWWRFLRTRPEMQAATATMERVLIVVLYSPHLTITFLNPQTVFANKLGVFALARFQDFSVLQSRPHEVWARSFSATLKDDLAYALTDAFETYPMMSDTNSYLDDVGKRYFEYRAELLRSTGVGLTAIYNRFHDREERHPEVMRLRDLHDEMDRAVLDAYGWADLRPRCEFLLDYDDDQQEVQARGRKPWRYRWPDEIRDEVLGRLLDLNRERAAARRSPSASTPNV